MNSSGFAHDVVTASGRWISPWFPPRSEHHQVDGIEFYVLDGTAVLMNAVGSFDSASLSSTFSTHARHTGARRMQITVGPGLVNGIGVEDLVAMGGNIVQTADVLALPIRLDARTESLDPTGISTTEVATRDDLATFLHTSNAAWGYPEPTENDIDAGLVDLHPGSFIAWSDGRAVGTGGYTVVDGMARLWGASVLPDHRHRGAYRALIDARLRSAQALSARMALVHAAPTSSPILRRLGFDAYGVRTTVELDV